MLQYIRNMLGVHRCNDGLEMVCVLMGVLSRNLSVETEKTTKKLIIAGVPTEIRTKHIFNTSRERYHHTNRYAVYIGTYVPTFRRKLLSQSYTLLS
jgi:hypothetical protein